METNPLVGKKIIAAFLAEDKMALRFDLEGGEKIIVKTDGDCCSHTWIEYIEMPENLLGMVIAVEEVEMPEKDYDKEKFECISFYGCKIHTEKGSCLLDYRNESNGYYGGSLAWPGDYFYGGAWNQNQSKEDWRKIA